MASCVVTLLTTIMVSIYGCGVDSAAAHMECAWDHQCPDGFYCYEESQFCTRCVECAAYKRKSSWRTCPKIPSDCGACLPGHEEEILHNGKTRDMCVPSSVTSNSLTSTVVASHSAERYIWMAAVTVLLLPIILYAFFRKGWRRDRGSVHHGLPHEEPPPYRCLELTNLSSNTSSEERLTEEDHVLRLRQQKDRLVQAVPFLQPDYIQPEFLEFDNNNTPEASIEVVEGSPPEALPEVDLHDDNTMPSNWTPAENENQLVNFEAVESDEQSESEETCEPSTKRQKTNSNSQESEETGNTRLNINLFINNKVTINKPY